MGDHPRERLSDFAVSRSRVAAAGTELQGAELQVFKLQLAELFRVAGRFAGCDRRGRLRVSHTEGASQNSAGNQRFSRRRFILAEIKKPVVPVDHAVPNGRGIRIDLFTSSHVWNAFVAESRRRILDTPTSFVTPFHSRVIRAGKSSRTVGDVVFLSSAPRNAAAC